MSTASCQRLLDVSCISRPSCSGTSDANCLLLQAVMPLRRNVSKDRTLIAMEHTPRTYKFFLTTFDAPCGAPFNGAYFNLDAIYLSIQPQTGDFHWFLRQAIASPPLGLRHRAHRFRWESRVWERSRNNFMQLPNPLSCPRVV